MTNNPIKPSEISKLYFTPGIAYEWRESNPTYPATDYVIKYKALNTLGKIEFQSSADGLVHVFNLSSTDTEAFVKGIYEVTIYAENISNSNKYIISKGIIEISYNPFESETQDTRSEARKMLEALQALELGRAGYPFDSFQIAGRSITYLKPDEIIKWRNYYARIVAAEEKKGLNQSQKIYTQFTNPI